MSDDIVTRLRELAIGSLYGISIAPFEHYNAAADEIERLRARVADWKLMYETAVKLYYNEHGRLPDE